MNTLRLWIGALLIIVFVSSGAAQQRPDDLAVEKEEYAVYALVIEGLSNRYDAKRFFVGASTEDFSCGGSSPNGFNINGCTGMRTKDQTSDQAIADILRDMPKLDKLITDDFQKKNQKTYALKDQIPTPASYKLLGTDSAAKIPKDWGTPDFALYFSRVGLSPDKADALVYVAVISWTNSSLSGGYFMHFQQKEKKWKMAEIARVWTIAS